MSTEVDEAVREALRVLEAAGIKPLDPAEQDEVRASESAVFYLREHAHICAERVEREAEDAKVREFRTVALEADGVWPGSISEWDLMGEAKKDLWRERYRAAREFFLGAEDGAEAEPAPRVLNYGDPEPDRGTKWQDQDGDLWEHDGRGWHWVPTVRMCAPNRRDWTAIEASYFPMTEVTV